jgi:uncharacterized RmlC-like cupin family protein
LAAETVDDGLYVEVLTCPPGERPGEHRHGHTEALFILDGVWTVSYRADEHSEPETATAGPWALVAVPAGW